MQCPWDFDEKDNASERHWRPLAKRGTSNVYANYSTRCVGTDWVELLVSPIANDQSPDARSVVETWLVRCDRDVGSWTATSYFSEDMAQGKYLGTADGFAREEAFKQSPQVSEICRFLASHPPMQMTAE
jgi:hypothetical protein